MLPWSFGRIFQVVSENNSLLRDLQRKLSILIAQENSLMIDTSKLVAEVANETTVEQSVLTLVSNMAANEAALSSQLAAAIAANDPVALAAVQTAIDSSVATLQANDAALASAVTANTPAAPVTPSAATPSAKS